MKSDIFVFLLVTCLHHVVCLDYGTITPNSASKLGCRIRPIDRNAVQYLSDYSVMYIFELEIYNGSSDPLRTDVSDVYKPWKWYRTSSGHGKTLLTLSFNFDVISMTVLAIGIERVPIKLKDYPVGCFANLTAEQRVDLIRERTFDNFRRPRQKENEAVTDDTTGEEESALDPAVPEYIYVCSGVVRNIDGYAQFGNRCCARDTDGKITCSEQEDNFWITVLYVCICLVKAMLFMFSPMMVPAYMYTAAYVSSEYVVKLRNVLKLKIFVSESATTSMTYKNRLTLEDFANWKRFRESVENLPVDKICHVKIPEVRINVKGKRIIHANEPPTGLLRSLYDNLVRCKIRGLDPFKDCCNKSIYASLQPIIRHKCSWEDLVMIVSKCLTLVLLIPLPFYLRLFVYYRFEEDELDARRTHVEKLGLLREFNPYRENLIQYFTPTHWLFVSTYSFYVISGVVLGFANPCVKDKIKSIAQAALSDMESISRTSVLQVVLGFQLLPFRKLGILALLICPIFSIISAPIWATIFVLYCIPTVYLAYRLIYHSKRKLGGDTSFFDTNRPFGRATRNVKRVHAKLAKLDKGVHVAKATAADPENQQTFGYGYGRCLATQRFLLQIGAAVFCLLVLFATLLLFVEAAGMIVEVLAFTMMGIIVNAGSTLRYVSMVMLVIVYMHSCYNNVYENYLEFNKTVIDDIMDRVEDLKKIASLPSSMQENIAFQVKPVDALDEIPTSVNLEKKTPQWRIGHLLLFFDSFDTPRIPLNLFKKCCQVRVHGAPGPVYINLLRATGKFSIIVVFLFFVMIVVMAFGSASQMSSTNQTLATLAGGFVPMLLRNVLSSKAVRLNLKTLSFKGQIDEIVSEYKQNWPINDMAVEEYDPDAVEEEEKEDDDDKDKDKDKDKVKDKENDKEKTKDGDDNKSNDGGDSKEKIESKDDDEEKNIAEKETMPPAMTTLPVPGAAFYDSDEDLRPKRVITGPQWLRRLSIAPPDDNFVDLFIDLSVGEEANPWQFMYGSSESVAQSMTMLNELYTPEVDSRMPYTQAPLDQDIKRNNINNNVNSYL